MTSSGGRFLRLWAILAGALPWVIAWWTYKLGIVIYSQIGFVRMLGVLEVLLGIVVLGTGLLAALCHRLAPPTGRWARLGFFGLALVNVILLGFTVFYLTPRFAPKLVLLLSLVFGVGVFVRFVREDAETQAFTTQALIISGLTAIALLCAPAPWIIAIALADHPHLAVSPLPPVGARVRADAPKRIILVSFDAMRARSTSLLDPTLDTTPTLLALSHEATTFTNVRSASDNTLVSMPTVLTGIRPSDYFPHVGNDSIYLREGFLTGLAGFLAPAGYRSYYATMLVNPLTFGLDGEFVHGRMTTGMFRRNQFNTHAFLPLNQVWDWTESKLQGRWDDEVDLHVDELPATREAFSDGLAYLKGEPGRTFLWLHIAVPHTPYHDVPKANVQDPGDPARYPIVTEGEVAAAGTHTLKRYQHIYEDYVRFGDAELGRFIAELRAAKLYDDSLLVVTSDHGEDFGQPGHIPHGNGIASEDVSHVPLLIHLPHQVSPRRVDTLVGHRDLVPSVLARVYTQPPDIGGVPLLDGVVPPDRYVYTWAMTTFYVPKLRQAETIAAFHGPYKYLVRYPTREESLYDLAKDPAAETNLAARLPDVLADMREHLRVDQRP